MERSHEPIHSGHFMTSNPHTDIQADEDEDVEVGSSRFFDLIYYLLGGSCRR